EVFVSEFFLRAPGLAMMLVRVLRIFGIVHALCVPFVRVRGNGINAPVRVNAEFRILQPFGNRVAFERIPSGIVCGGDGAGQEEQESHTHCSNVPRYRTAALLCYARVTEGK